MSGWTLFFILVGVVYMTAQLFRIIDAIDHMDGATLNGGAKYEVR